MKWIKRLWTAALEWLIDINDRDYGLQADELRAMVKSAERAQRYQR